MACGPPPRAVAKTARPKIVVAPSTVRRDAWRVSWLVADEGRAPSVPSLATIDARTKTQRPSRLAHRYTITNL